MKNTLKTAILKPIAASILLASSGISQAAEITNLAAEGANATQQSLGVFIDSWLNDPANAGFASAGGLAQELFNLCQNYAAAVTAANTSAQVADALNLLDLVSNEEIAAIGSGLTDTGHDQTISVIGRLQSLRAGTPTLASLNNIGHISGGAAGADFSKFSYYANVSYGDGEKDRTRSEQGFDFDSQALTFGADYRFDDNIVAGVALGLGQSDVQINQGLGDTESDTLSLTFYGTYYQDNWYADASLGYAQHDYDSTRRLTAFGITQNLASSTEGDSISWSLGGGYTQVIKGWNTDYALRLNGVDASVDGYREAGGSLALNVGSQDVESLQAVLSAQASKAFSKSWGVIAPFVGIEMHQEFEDETRIVTARYQFDNGNNQFSFVSDDADDNYFLISAGSSFLLAEGRQLFVNLDHIVGLSDVESNTLTAGIRFEL